MTVIEQCKKNEISVHYQTCVVSSQWCFVLNVVLVLMLDAVLLLSTRTKHVVNVQYRRVIFSVVYFSTSKTDVISMLSNIGLKYH